MDLQFLWMFLKIIIFLPFILLLIYISVKYGGNKLQDIQNGKYVKVLERTPVSKENSLLVVKIGDKAYVMSSTANKVDILVELEKEEISKIETSKVIPEYTSFKEFYKKTHFKDFCNKLKLKKEGKNE